MKITANVRIIKKLFDHGYVVRPLNKADFKSALLLLNIQNNDDKFLISKDIVDAEIGGVFDLVDKDGKHQLFLKELSFMSLQLNVKDQEKFSAIQKENKNRYLAQRGSVSVGSEGVFKKQTIKILSIGKPFLLKQKLSDIPDWLFEKLQDLEVCWIYFEYNEKNTDEKSVDKINIKAQIVDYIQYFKHHGEKTRRKAIIHAESPGNVNLQRFCDLRRIDPENKVVFVISENYIWLLEQNRNDPLPNIKLNNVNFGGWILTKKSNLHMLDKLEKIDQLLKITPDLYSENIK